MALIVIAVGAFFLPFNGQNYAGNFHFPPYQIPDFFTRYQTWDAQHYLYLAQFGYTPHLVVNAFYPLFPFLIHWFCFLFLGHQALAAFILSTVFTVIAMALFYQLVYEAYGESLAWKSCLCLLAFPTSFFMGLIYADSLFLMLVMAFFYGETKNKKWLMLACAFLLPLTKPAGILVGVGILFKLLFEKKPQWREAGEVLLASLLGFALYLGVMQFYTGDMMAGFAAQAEYHDSKSVASLFHPFSWFVKNFVNVQLGFNQPFTGFLDRFAFVSYLTVLAVFWRRLPLPWAVYALVLGLVSGLSGDMTSYIRYMLCFFPFFVAVAMGAKSSWRYWIGACVVAQILFVLLYSLNDWVA